jgi:hypothetical protein
VETIPRADRAILNKHPCLLLREKISAILGSTQQAMA